MSDSRHQLAGQALDCALHGLPEPGKDWRNLLPPEGWGAALAAGSANIPLMAIVGCLIYGPRAWAVRVLLDYARICWSRWCLAEPWSRIYGAAIFTAWAVVAKIARQIGERELEAAFLKLLAAFAGTSRLMESRLTSLPASASKYERQRLGTFLVCIPGCRSWGLSPELEGGFSDVHNVGMNRLSPAVPGSRAYGQAGQVDDWGWIPRALFQCRDILVEVYRPFAAGATGRDFVASIPRWAAREDYTLFGWADGSRLGIMGADEPERRDEDDDNNTPGTLLKGVLGGKLVVAPRFPDPLSGLEHLRQTAVEADIDGNASSGWSLWHSKLGERRAPDGGFLTRVEPYTGSPLEFAILIPAGDPAGWRYLTPGGIPNEPAPPPTPPPAPAPAEPTSWREKVGF